MLTTFILASNLTVLSKSQATMPSSALQSSSTLGTGRPLTHIELHEKAEDQLVKKSLLGQTGKRKRHQDVFAVQDHEEDSYLDGEDDKPEVSREHPLERSPLILEYEGVTNNAAESRPTLMTQEKSIVVGSALQRNPDGSLVAPKVRKRTKSKVSMYQEIADLVY